MQFTDLKDTMFLKSVNSFLDTNSFFQIQKYDPSRSISKLNGNIIALRDKKTSTLKEYIIIDNDPENFKLIESSKLKEYIENKIKETQPTSPFKDGSISMTFDLDNNVNDDTMECLLLYYVNKFKVSDDYKDELKKLNDKYGKNAVEYNKYFEIMFNDFLLKEASTLYKNGEPELIQYS